jgi:hypothetical protein
MSDINKQMIRECRECGETNKRNPGSTILHFKTVTQSKGEGQHRAETWHWIAVQFQLQHGYIGPQASCMLAQLVWGASEAPEQHMAPELGQREPVLVRPLQLCPGL